MKSAYFGAFLMVLPFAARAAGGDFASAAQLLAAAKNGDIQRIQILINNGADVNYVDNTGLSLVCTALMNNDNRAAQILQMYGADASNCDRQIKNYKTRNNPTPTGGFFSGLSTSQNLAIAAAGTAVLVGGIYLLTDWFNPDDKNSHSSGGSSSGGGSGGGSSGGTDGTVWNLGALPDGPAKYKANYDYAADMSYYATDESQTANFSLMNAGENYLLLMRGYSPFARGYLGMRTLRSHDSNRVPLNLSIPEYSTVSGGMPINVALVTANGINADQDSSLASPTFPLVWGDNPTGSTISVTGMATKYYNDNLDIIEPGFYEYTEASNLIGNLDLSGFGTAIHNTSLGNVGADNLLAKIVGGNTSATSADFIGFMPNGQMTIYRTGGGTGMVAPTGTLVSGTCSRGGENCSGTAFQDGDVLNLFGQSFVLTLDGNSVELTVSGDDDPTYTGYIGANGLLYLMSGGTDFTPMAFSLSGTTVTQTGVQGSIDYKNYAALYDAAQRSVYGNETGTRSFVYVIGNLDVLDSLHATDAKTVDDILSFSTDLTSASSQTNFTNLIGSYYNTSTTDALTNPATNASVFFNGLGQTYFPITVFSTGAAITATGEIATGQNPYAGATKVAGFENAAPLIYNNLEHLFMSVVAVGADTSSASDIVANSDAMPGEGKYKLAQWMTGAATQDTADDVYYKARVCGVAGTGSSTIDPWCFAAVGVTDENAAAAAAGAAGVLKSAFYYMDSKQIFTLLALTADGPFLNRLTSGTKLTPDTLKTHLAGLYTLPGEYQFRVDNGEDYLSVFKEVFGYGVINLERATTPGTNLYFYTGNKIVSTAGNAYWRAAIGTKFHPSAALSLGRTSISTSAYDVLSSMDGDLTLPRIWENNFSFDNGGRHGLYMGDVLGDLKTRDTSDAVRESIGDLTFSLARSDRTYDDEMNGMDTMRFEYAMGNLNLVADYQRYLTDGESRFFGMSNPILALATNAVTGGANYKYGRWHLGARGFSGAITDEGLLENDPAISAEYRPLRLGLMSGGQSELGWGDEKFSLTTAFGMAHESNTLLGASATGFVGINGADTRYVDATLRFAPMDYLKLTARASFAHTTPNESNDAMVSWSEMDSNAFALGADIGNWTFGASMPLAVTRGSLYYAVPNYDIVESDTGYGIALNDVDTRDIDVAAKNRELRFNVSYRHNFGAFTDGAAGFIYRVNPNNIKDFGNESIFMLKMTHRVGI